MSRRQCCRSVAKQLQYVAIFVSLHIYDKYLSKDVYMFRVCTDSMYINLAKNVFVGLAHGFRQKKSNIPRSKLLLCAAVERCVIIRT